MTTHTTIIPAPVQGNKLRGMKSSARAHAGTFRNAAAIAAIADSVLILLFAAIGRGAHERGDVILGVFLTAWPFLAGAAAGWLVFRVWRRPLAVRSAGLPVWISSVVIGMLLRFLTGQAVVPAFVIVALISLGILLPGYRLLLAGLARLSKRPARS